MFQIEQNSFDFDQFDPVDNHNEKDKSFSSDLFQQNQPNIPPTN